MPESQLQTLIIIAAAATGLLLFCLFVLVRISWRLARIEKALRNGVDSGQTAEKSDSGPSLDLSGAFGKFLSDRPELLAAPKSEQFAAYRKWRKDQGLNWEGR